MRARLLLALLLVACSDPTIPADGGADAALVDAGSVDGGAPDGGPSGPRWCQPCRLDAQCGEGLCLYFEDGTTGCGHACGSDADCADLPIAARCLAPDEGLAPQCMPTDGTCAPVAAGSGCDRDEDCRGTHDRCVEGLAAGGSVCTTSCASDADCPFLASHCVDLGAGAFCAPDPSSSLDTCLALIAAGDVVQCGADGSCPGTSACYGAGELRVCLSPPTLEGCSGTAVDVEGGQVCLPAIPGGSAWVPACSCVLRPASSMLDDALASIDRDRCDIAFPTATYRRLFPENAWLAAIAQDPFRLSITDAMHGDWLSVPQIARELGASFDAVVGSAERPITQTIASAAWIADLRVPLPGTTTATDLAAELEALVSATGGAPERADLDAQVAALPSGAAMRLAPVIAALTDAIVAREAALAIYEEGTREALYALGPGIHLGAGTGSVPRVTSAWAKGALRGDVDLERMAIAATALTAAIEDAELTRLAGASATLTIETPRGRIAIRGASADTYEGDAWSATLFLLDTGGDDVYRAPIGANASIANGVSIAIDLAGADRYGYVEVPIASDVGPEGHARLPSDDAGRVTASATRGPSSLSNVGRQGSGRLGIAMLLDYGVANDSYRSLRMSQGYGALGIGVLWDAGGDDTYEGEAGVQGAASFGLGILVDRAGTDRYVAYHASQGFAYSRAVGLLYDASGDDTYFAHPSDVLYFSPQDPGGSNSSFAQGAGFGRRADGSDGVFMSGGVAILRDREGDDRYTCGIFGQATGYWFGSGFLLDLDGADHYDGQWYVQAGDAHYAIAALIDEGGNDEYNALARRMNAALGGGHDFSVAWLVDRAGDDVWRGPGLSFGTGHAGGFGGFVDAAGIDTYDATGDLSFGNASIETPGDGLRRLTGSVGVFLERGGVDTYARPTITPLANDAAWTQSAHADENEHGAGIDRESGALGIPGFTD